MAGLSFQPSESERGVEGPRRQRTPDRDGTSSLPVRLLGLLLAVHVALLAWEAAVHSPTIDEIHTLPGGVAHYLTGRLDIVINNPPHVGLIAAVPVLLSGADTSAAFTSQGGRSIGRSFIRGNERRFFWLFTLGRWACLPFSLIGAVGCFLWARILYGPWPGLLAATLWCFSPNILAQGQLVSHDVPAASMGVVACFCFWRWLRKPLGTRAVVAGFALGLALLTKATALIYFGLWPLLWVFWQASGDDRRSLRAWSVRAAWLAAILVVAVDVLNCGYGFSGSLMPLDSYQFRSHSLGSLQNLLRGSLLQHVPVPVPRAYMEGIDFQRSVLEGRLPYQFTYLRGQWSTSGVPYFYLYALAVKSPLGTWGLIFLAALARWRGIDGQRHARDEVVLLAPAAVLLLAASSFLVWTDHIRHVLPVVPFLFVWISRFANVEWGLHPWLARVGAASLAFSIASSLWVYPHMISYFNELAGGPLGGHYRLVSSNIDYGQDLLKLKNWYDRHPEARPFGLAYWDLDSVDPRAAGIEYFVPPSSPPPGVAIEDAQADTYGPRPGWYAVNVNLLHGDQWPGRQSFPELGYYGYFLEFEPVARAGYSINIYHLSVSDANRVRRQLGLPSLEEAPR